MKDKKKLQLIYFGGLIIVLLIALLAILNISDSAKEKSNNIMNKFHDYYESKDKKVIFYYDSLDSESSDGKTVLSFLIQISKDYNIDYLEIDKSNLNSKNRKEIENKLGVSSPNLVVAVVQDQQIKAISDNYLEGNKLVDLFIEAKLLDEGSKYKPVDNIKFIDYEEYKKIIKSKDKKVIIIGQAGCTYCIGAKEILNNISKAYKLDVHYLDVKDLQNNEYKELFEELPKKGYDNTKLTEQQTFDMPTLLVFKDDKVKSYLSGAKELEGYIKFLKEQEVIE